MGVLDYAPLSRNEAILQNMLGANNILEPPQSREEALLQAILEGGGGGGGEGYTKAQIDQMFLKTEQNIENATKRITTAEINALFD